MNKLVPNMISLGPSVLQKEYVTPNIMLVRIKVPQTFTFHAGQYVMLDMVLPSGESVEKPFSIASPPSQTGEIELFVKMTPGKGATEFFENTTTGSSLVLRGPMGTMVTRGEVRPLHFIAAGIGIAPFRSIIKDLFLSQYEAPLRLSHLREPESWGVLDDELAQWYRACKNFSYSLIHASPELAGPEWGWRHLNMGFPEHDEKIYLSGSKEFVSKLKETLLARGFVAERLITENI